MSTNGTPHAYPDLELTGGANVLVSYLHDNYGRTFEKREPFPWEVHDAPTPATARQEAQEAGAALDALLTELAGSVSERDAVRLKDAVWMVRYHAQQALAVELLDVARQLLSGGDPVPAIVFADPTPEGRAERS